MSADEADARDSDGRPRNMTETLRSVPLRCTNCGTVHPEDIITEDGEPPEEIETVCGTRWGGCGSVHVHEHAPGESWEEIDA